MMEELVKSVALYISIAIPTTVAIGNLAKVLMEWITMRHSIKATIVKQNHDITTNYIDRALDPTVPLALRHQLLRFLSTPDLKGSRLSTWAKTELERVGHIVDDANRAIEAAEKDLNAAKTPIQVVAAEEKLANAIKRQKSLMEPPITAPLTAAALRAGFIIEKDLSGLEMRNVDLMGMRLTYRKLRGADFSQSNLTGATLQGCDLRAASFENSILQGTTFYEADLRCVIFRKAKISNCNFQEAHLEGADLHEAVIELSDFRVTYDKSTRWPEGFDPVVAGAVKTD